MLAQGLLIFLASLAYTASHPVEADGFQPQPQWSLPDPIADTVPSYNSEDYLLYFAEEFEGARRQSDASTDAANISQLAKELMSDSEETASWEEEDESEGHLPLDGADQESRLGDSDDLSEDPLASFSNEEAAELQLIPMGTAEQLARTRELDNQQPISYEEGTSLGQLFSEVDEHQARSGESSVQPATDSSEESAVPESEPQKVSLDKEVQVQKRNALFLGDHPLEGEYEEDDDAAAEMEEFLSREEALSDLAAQFPPMAPSEFPVPLPQDAWLRKKRSLLYKVVVLNESEREAFEKPVPKGKRVKPLVEHVVVPLKSDIWKPKSIGPWVIYTPEKKNR